MADWHEIPDCSLVTAILPRRSVEPLIEFLIEGPGHPVFSIPARGTLIKDRWYQSFLPAVNPEQDIIQMLVPNGAVDHRIRQITAIGKLQLYGAGAVYAVACSAIHYRGDPTDYGGPPDTRKPDGWDAALSLKRDLVGIFGVVQPRITNTLTRDAVRLGAPGPTVHLCEGRGIGDRLGWLRFTQDPEKEVMQVMVDAGDAQTVFESLAATGRLDEPARGILYLMPVEEGIVNLPSVIVPERHKVSMQQIVQAIDELQGNSAWRAQLFIDARDPGRDTRNIFFGRNRERRHMFDVQCMSCFAPRKYASELIQAAISAGAPATTCTHGKLIDSRAERTASGIRLNEERSQIQIIMPEPALAPIRRALQAAADANDMRAVLLFNQSVPRALTYLG